MAWYDRYAKNADVPGGIYLFGNVENARMILAARAAVSAAPAEES